VDLAVGGLPGLDSFEAGQVGWTATSSISRWPALLGQDGGADRVPVVVGDPALGGCQDLVVVGEHRAGGRPIRGMYRA
jgi:hypothetical protein